MPTSPVSRDALEISSSVVMSLNNCFRRQYRSVFRSHLAHCAFRFPTGNGAERVILDALTELARTVPETLGPSAVAYIIQTFTITWPVVYLAQGQLFATSFFRLNWLNRMLKGG